MTVLNSGSHTALLTVLGVLSLAAAIVGLVTAVAAARDGVWGCSVAFLVATLIVGASGFTLLHDAPSSGYIDVCFSEPVNLSEFAQKYDIVSQQGEIFRLKEKEP